MRAAEISLPAIRHNVRTIRERANGAALIAVVKANGYGHGAAAAAQAAVDAGAAIIGVADLEEALALREAGIEAPVLCWLHGPAVDFAAGVAADIEIGINSLAQLESLASAAEQVGVTASIHLKVDTGLSRNGAAPDEWAALFARMAELSAAGRIRVRGLFSHLANAGEESDLAQAEQFDRAIAALAERGVRPEYLHLSASAATFSRPQLRYTAVRVGMAIYGLSPFAGTSSAELGLVPAMTLTSQLVALRRVSAGTGVSYGYNHVCETDTTLGLVPIGYADGMPRALNGAGASVTVHGVRCPIVGRIGMDQFIVDLGAVADRAAIGDAVVLFGDPESGAPAIEEWAELMRTINYEIVVGIGARVVRIPVEEELA